MNFLYNSVACKKFGIIINSRKFNVK